MSRRSCPTGADDAPSSRGVTVDRFHRGRVELVQPVRGAFRCGLDTVLLASVLEADTAGAVVDLGCGSGGVGLMVASRCAAAEIWCVDNDAAALDRLAAALARPVNAAFARRVRPVCGDVAERPERWNPVPPRAASVLVNPPFTRQGAGRVSPSGPRQSARGLPAAGLAPWLLAARRLLAPGGLLAAIVPPALLPDLLLPQLGDARLHPIHTRAGAAARRVVVTARLGRRSPLQLMPPLVVHGPGEEATSEAERLLAGDCSLSEAIAAQAR